MTVDGDVYLDRLRADDGRINFRSATLGSVFADHCELRNPDAYSLSLNQATIKGSVRLAGGFSSVGLVVLNRCLIEGRLQLAGSFVCPAPTPANEHGHAIEAISTTARGGIDLGWKQVSPSVDFTDATTTFLADDPAAWPERFAIAGLTYERFESPQGTKLNRVWDEGARSAWLGRQAEFESGPYEQAAKVFRQHGYTTEAEHILIAQRRHAGQVRRPHVIWPRRLIDAIYSTIGYGYRPSRVLWVLAALLVLVIASLEIPAAQATLRANNGNGQVYATNGLVVSARPVGAPPAVRRQRPGAGRFVRRRGSTVLQPGPLRDRHRGPADLTRPAHDLVPRSVRARRPAHALVAQPRHPARLAAVVDLRPVASPAVPKPCGALACKDH